MSQYQPTSYDQGTPSRKISNNLGAFTSTNNKVAASTTSNVTQQVLTSVPTYQYVTKSSMTTTTTTSKPTGKTTVITPSQNPMIQSGIRYSQQIVNGNQSTHQSGIIGQQLTQSIVQQQNNYASVNNMNGVTSPRMSQNNSDLASSIIAKYKSQQLPSSINNANTTVTFTAPLQPIITTTTAYSSFNHNSTPTQLKKATSPTNDLQKTSSFATSQGSPLHLRSQIQQENNLRNSVSQNLPGYVPFKNEISKYQSSYIPATSANQQQVFVAANMPLINSNSHPNLQSGLANSYNHLSASNLTKDNLNKLPSQVSDKLIEEFQKLTETNLKFFMQNKQKWKDIEENLKHENEDLKNKINTLHESYSQANRSMSIRQPDVSFSLQKDLEIAHIYEQKIQQIQQELDKSQLEIDQYKRSNAETQEKNEELNETCRKLNVQIHAQLSKSQEGKFNKMSENGISEAKIEEIKRQYEQKLQSQKVEFNQTIENMNGQILILETSLTQEKTCNQNLQSEIQNISSLQLFQTKNQDLSNILDLNMTNNNKNGADNKELEIRQQYETKFAAQQEKFNQELTKINGQIYSLEANLNNEKFTNQKLQSEIQNLSTIQYNSEQSRIYQTNPIIDSTATQAKIDEVKKQYEQILSTQKDQFNQEIKRMNGQMADLEAILTNEKFTNKKLQNEIQNVSQQQINFEQSRINADKARFETQAQIEEVKKQYEQVLSSHKDQYNLTLLKMNTQILELESSLTNEKYANKKLQNEILNISQQQINLDQSQIEVKYKVEVQAQIEQVKNHYEQILKSHDEQYNLTQMKMKTKILELESTLDNVKTTNQRLQSEMQNISQQQINQEQSVRVDDKVRIETQGQIDEIKKQYELLISSNQQQYHSTLNQMNQQLALLETDLTNQKDTNSKLENEIHNISFANNPNNEQSQIYEEQIESLKKQVDNLHAQNQKINQQNMELTQTQLEMAQLANDNQQYEELQNQIQNLQVLNQSLTLQNEEIMTKKEKQFEERTEEYRQIIQRMDQENFSVIQNVEERQEKEVRNQQVSQMDSILFETQIEELNETIRQLQQQLEVQHDPLKNQILSGRLQDSPDTVHILKREDNLINIQQNYVSQQDEQLQQYEEENKQLKEELNKQQDSFEHSDLKNKKQISDIESKLFLVVKEVSEKKIHIEELEKQKKALSEQIFSFEEKEHALHKQVVEAKEELHRIQSENQFKEKESQKHHALSTSQIVNEHEMQLNKLKAEIQQIQNEYTIKQSQAEQNHTSQMAQLSTQIQTLSLQIEEKNKLVEEKQKKLNEQLEVSKKHEERIQEMVQEREELIKQDKDIQQQSVQLKEIMDKEYKNKIDGYITTIKQHELQIETHNQTIQANLDAQNEQTNKYQEIEKKLLETQQHNQQLELKWSQEKQDIQNESNKSQFELKTKLSEFEKTIAEKVQSEHILKTDLEKYQNQLATIASQLQQKETQLTLFKKENTALSQKCQEIEEDSQKVEEKLKSELETVQQAKKELEQKHEKQIKQYERIKKEKEENDMIGNEEIQKLKLNYEALLESEKAAKEDIKKEFIIKVDELKIQVARHDSKNRTTEDKHQKQAKTLQKEIDGLKQLNDKKIEAMKSIQENCKKLEEEKNTFGQSIKKKEQKHSEELKAVTLDLEAAIQEKKKIHQAQEILQKELNENKSLVETYVEKEEKLTNQLKVSEEQRLAVEKQWTLKNEQTINEYESKITEKNQEFEKILSTKQGDSQQMQELTQKIMKQEKELREKENSLNSKIQLLESSIQEKETKCKSLEEEKSKIATQLQEKLTILTKEIETHKQKIQQNEDKIEIVEKELKEKIQSIKNLEIEKSGLEEKSQKQEEKVVLISTQLEQTKIQKKDIEDRLSKKLKEKDTEQSIISSDYNEKIKLYKSTIEQLQNRSGDINFSQDLKFSQISKISNNNSDNSAEHNDKLSNMSGKFMGGAALSQSRMSVNSQRSKEETRSMYKKLSQMSMATAAMMSAKHDYVSLKELAKSIDDHDHQQNHSNNQEIDSRLTRSDIQK